jgi:hypothetical protein
MNPTARATGATSVNPSLTATASARPVRPTKMASSSALCARVGAASRARARPALSRADPAPCQSSEKWTTAMTMKAWRQPKPPTSAGPMTAPRPKHECRACIHGCTRRPHNSGKTQFAMVSMPPNPTPCTKKKKSPAWKSDIPVITPDDKPVKATTKARPFK